MKKQCVSALIVLGIVFGMNSCKKDWTCKCTFTTTYPGGVSTTSDLEYFKEMTKSDAKKKCDDGDSSGGNTTVDCELN